MGEEMVVIAMGSGTTLGRLLDPQRVMACASRAIACPWLF